MNKKMNKRGQITVFIVVGIIILFAVAFVLYAASIQPGFRIFGVKETSIQQYIGMCLETTSESAINQIGTRGGYLELPKNIAINERVYFSFSPRSEPKIPLWYYRGEQRIPTKEAIQSDISNYVVNNIDNCLNNFELFKDQYELSLDGDVSAITTITDNDVIVKLNYPLKTIDKLTKEEVKQNYVQRTMNVKLGKMLKAGFDILKSENKNLFFENMTIDLLSMSSDFPFTGLDFSCSPKTWKKSQLIEFAKNMIYYNTQKVTIEGNSFKLFEDTDLYAKNHFVMPMQNTYSDIGVVFFYPKSARFELHVRPNDNEILVSNLQKAFGLIPLCINTWHFTYDIEYPLLVTMKDEKAFSGRGFIFNFGMPVTISSNAGNKKDFPQTIYETPIPDYNFCSDVAEKTVDVRVRNAFTNEELYKAQVGYRCIKYYCDLGNTTADSGIYRLRTKLPAACTNGILTASLNGYLDGSTFYTGQDVVDINLKPTKLFKVQFLKHDSNNFQRTEPLKSGESVVLTVRNSKDKLEEYYYTEEPSEGINLIYGDGSYKVEAILMQDGKRITGGYVGDMNLSYGDVAGKSTITFNLVQKIPIAVTEQQQADTANYLFTGTAYQKELKPTFS